MENSVKTRYEILKKTLTKTQESITLLQAECQHPNSTFKYGANTGNYDPSSNAYWKDHTCPDCGKRWTEFY